MMKIPDLFKRSPRLCVTFYLRGGHAIVAHDVKSVETTKTPEGNYASYKIEWINNRTPPFFSLALDHIVAIVAVKG